MNLKIAGAVAVTAALVLTGCSSDDDDAWTLIRVTFCWKLQPLRLATTSPPTDSTSVPASTTIHRSTSLCRAVHP